MKLTTKLILIFLLLSLIPVIIVGYVAYDHGRRTIEDDTLQNLISMNTFKAAQVSDWMNASENALHEIANHSYMSDKWEVMASHDQTDPAYLESRRSLNDRFFSPAIRGSSGLKNLFLVRTSDGLVLASSDETLVGEYGGDEPYFTEGKQNTYVQLICCQSPLLASPGIVIGVPVKDKQGNFVAVLAGCVDMEELSGTLAKANDRRRTQNTYLIDEFNRFVTNPESGKGNVQGEAVLAGNSKTTLNSDGDVTSYGLYKNYRSVPVIGVDQELPKWGLYIQTELGQAEAFAPVRNLRNIILAISVGVALGVILLALFFSRTITSPVRRLSRGAVEISQGNLDYRMNSKARDEVGDLSRSFDHMAESLRTTTVSRDELTVEVAERKRAEEKINRRLEFEQTIAGISARFVGDSDINNAIDGALQDMAVLSGAHRTYLFLLREDGNTIDNTHEWCAEGVSPQIDNLQGISTRAFAAQLKKMCSGEGMNIPDISKLSLENDEEREMRSLLESQGIKSLIIVPLFIANQWAGFIGFDNVSAAGEWEDDARALLRLSADIIGNALEKTRAWKALSTSEERYRLHFQNASDIIVTFDTETRILDVSPSIETMLGYAPSELVGKRAVDTGILLANSEQEVMSDLNRLVPGEMVPPRTYRFACKDGTIKLGEVTNTPLIQKGKIMAFTAVIRDVTERRQAERALRESEEKYRTVVNNIPDIVWIGERGKGIAFISPTFQAIMGYAPEELLQGGGYDWLGNVHPDDVRKVKDSLKALSEKEIHFAVEHRFRRKDGEWIWLYARAVNAYVKDGKWYIYGLTSDITERKRVETLAAIRHDLAQSLSATDELDKGTSLCLEAAIAASGMDSGGIYLVDQDSGGLRLVCHRGLSADFIASVSYYAPDSPNAQLVMKATPVYTEFSKTDILLKEVERLEGLQAIAVLPIVHEGRLVACLHVASHTVDKFSVHVRTALEQITGHAGEGIARLIAEEALRQSEQRYRLHFENVSDVIVEFDGDLKLLDVSPSVEKILGYPPSELIGGGLLDIGVVAEDSVQELLRNLSQFFAGEPIFNQTYKFICKDGTARFGEVNQAPIIKAGKAVTYVAVIRDVTERQHAEEELRRLSVTDELTGIPNRRHFYDVIESEITCALQNSSSFSLIMLDLDRFKLYNDTYGHANGDNILKEFARFLASSLKKNDMLFRYGGDEFILLVRSSRKEKAERVATRIMQKWEQAVRISLPSSQMLLQISAGIAEFPGDGDTVDSLMNLVDIALYQSKRRGGATTTRVSDLDEMAASGILGLATLDQIYALAAAVDARDKGMYGHATRVTALSEKIGKAMNLPKMDLVKLHSAALLHDIGKFGVSEAILGKPGKPTEEEWKLLTSHSAEGAKIVEHVKDLADIVPDIRHHHEWYDGSGYPGQLKGKEIPLRARIIAVADTYDTLTSVRSYAEVLSHTEAMAELRRCSGTQFDPEIIEVFFRVMGEEQRPGS